MDEQQEFWKKREEQIKRETEEKILNKLKRFDEVFRMLLLVMTITTSIGLSSYHGFDLSFTLLFLVMALGLWIFGNLLGSNPLMCETEILLKLHAWVIALLVTFSTFAKFWLKASTLDIISKGLVSIFTYILTVLAYHYFGDMINPYNHRRHLLMWDFGIILAFQVSTWL